MALALGRKRQMIEWIPFKLKACKGEHKQNGRKVICKGGMQNTRWLLLPKRISDVAPAQLIILYGGSPPESRRGRVDGCLLFPSSLRRQGN